MTHTPSTATLIKDFAIRLAMVPFFLICAFLFLLAAVSPKCFIAWLGQQAKDTGIDKLLQSYADWTLETLEV